MPNPPGTKLTPPVTPLASEGTTNRTMSSFPIFSTAITRIRDILRRISITGMDSMRHICLYLMGRFITIEIAPGLGVPPQFAWENLLITLRGSAGEEKALEAFCHPTADCLVAHFDRLFDTSKFPFDLKPSNPHHRTAHKEILNVLNPIDMKTLDTFTDILGWVYEQHLKTGSSSASRDLGQYFTDRDLCNFMVRLCVPRFTEEGVPESICDPTMGTAGFLTSAIKFYKRAYKDTPVDWTKHINQIHGCETDERVAGVARLNVLMETKGGRPEHLCTRNSLCDDLPQTGYDVILANMPFGLKGLKYADCCERVKNLKISTTKSEPLFLQLMMVSLNPGGRCAVVVPDGMLVNNSKGHNGTRKYLLDNFELKQVIKMEGSFFMNTSIRPSILFFENTGKPTTAVEFWKVTKTDDDMDDGELVVTVPREKIGDDCSLDMRRYLDAEKPVANPAGFPMVRLGDILTDYPVKKPVATTSADGGIFSLFSSSCDIFKHSVAEFSGRPYLLQGSRGTISKATHYCDTPFSASNNVFVLSTNTPDDVSLKFVYYYLRLNNVADQVATTSVISMLTKAVFREIKVPLPPRAIQDEIVATLDRIYAPGTTELADTLKMTDKAMDLVLASPSGATLEPIVEAQRLIRKSAHMVADVNAQMVADVKAQMVAIMKAIIARGYPSVSLGDLYDSPKITKKFNSGQMDNTGDAKFFNGKWSCPVGVHSQHSYESDKEYFVLIKDGGGDHSSDTVGMGKFFNVTGKCAITSHNMVLVQKGEDADRHRYVHYYMTLNVKELRDKAKYSINLGSISVSDILGFPIHMPDKSTIRIILSRLDALQSQLTALETLQKQSEDNARFILESYLGSAQTTTSTAPLTPAGGCGDYFDEDDHSTISHT